MNEDTKSTSGPAAKSPATPVVNGTTAEIIDRWFVEQFQQPPIAHRTDCYNQALAARDKLKELFAARDA